MLSFFNLPCAGFCKMSELLTVPRILIGNWQLPPDATLMSPVEFSPQSASAINIGQSEAASAGDTDIEPVAPTISAKAANSDNRMVAFLVFMQTHTYQSFLGRPRLELRLSGIFSSLGIGLLVVESPQLMQIN
jgi:hypothetical protein